MIIQSTPEDEKLIEERLRSGAFHSERLERAMEEFDSGGGIPGSQVPQRLQEF